MAGEALAPEIAATVGPMFAKYGIKNLDKGYKAGKALFHLGTKVVPKVGSIAGHLLSPKSIKSAASYAKGLTTVRGFKKFFKRDLRKGAAAVSHAVGGVSGVVGEVGDIVGTISPEAGKKISHFHQIIEKYHKKGKHHASTFGRLGEKVGLM